MTRPGQMRRHARRMRRYGLQPMMVISGNDRLPETLGVLFARWILRYRSELAPVTAAVTAMLTAWWLHAEHPWWGLVALLAAMVAALVAMAFGRLLGLPVLAERLYAATVALTAGAWIALASAAGPFTTPMPQSLAIGGTVLALPWWAHRRRRARVRVERKLAAWPDIAHAVGLPGSEVMSAMVDVWGWRARFRLARGQTIADVISRLPAIESGLGTYRGAARPAHG